jgi:hypothetical protein
VSRLLEALSALFGREKLELGSPLRLTEGGLWHATPLPVLAAAVPVITDHGLVRSRRPVVVLNAGAGDGRLLSALALGLPEDVKVHLLGLEIDPALAAAAKAQFRKLALAPVNEARRPRIALGDYLAVAGCAALGVAPTELDLVFNYPDGNERRLLAWLRRHAGPQTRLALLSPDHEPAMDAPPFLRARVAPSAGSGVAWSLSVYAADAVGQ